MYDCPDGARFTILDLGFTIVITQPIADRKS